MREGYLPLGLAHQVSLRDVAEGAVIRWADVPADASDPVVRIRHEMEATFGKNPASNAA